MGRVIPPSMKAIIGMMTSKASLCDTICSGEQYHRATSLEIWYLFLKASILARESTKCLNLPIWTSYRGVIESDKGQTRNWKAEETGRGGKRKI